MWALFMSLAFAGETRVVEAEIPMLFAAERAQVEDAVAAYLPALLQGTTVKNPAEQRTIAQHALASKSPDGATSCGAAVPVEPLLDHLSPGVGLTRVSSDCTASGCRLIVAVSGPKQANGYREPQGAWAAPVSRPHVAKDWVAAVGSLAPIDSAPTPGPLGAARAPEEITLRVDGYWGKWSKPPKAGSFGGGVGLASCRRPMLILPRKESFLLQINSEGKVTQCERTQASTAEHEEAFDCVCSAMENRQLPNGAGNRRALVTPRWPIEPQKVDGKVVRVWEKNSASTDSFSTHVALRPVRLQMQACAAEANKVGFAVEAHWDVGRDGKVTSSTTKVEGADAALEACVTKAAKAAAFPCPLDGEGAAVDVSWVFK